MEVLLVKDKWDTYTMGDERGVLWAALELLRKRVDEGFWYDGAEEEYAKEILRDDNIDEALYFLLNRRDYEYEWVEVQTIQGLE